MSTITQSSVNSQYATSASTAQMAGTTAESTSKSKHKKTSHPKRHHQSELSKQMQAQQKLFQQLLEMMTSFMQDTIKKLSEMFQGMVDPSAGGTTDATSGQTSSSNPSASTGAAGTTESTGGSDSGTSSAGNCGTGSCDDSSGSTDPSDSTSSGTASGQSLEAAVDDQGCVTVLTEDGFKIRCEGKDQAWTIIRPDGQVTRIWGDPHVHESDGDNWDFKERSTFKFGNNKVTVETVPAPNGQTYSSTITIYNGNERVTISGLDQNAPKLVAVGGDGKLHDAQLSDGQTYAIGQESNGQEQWSKDGVAVAATSSDPQVAPAATN